MPRKPGIPDSWGEPPSRVGSRPCAAASRMTPSRRKRAFTGQRATDQTRSEFQDLTPDGFVGIIKPLSARTFSTVSRTASISGLPCKSNALHPLRASTAAYSGSARAIRFARAGAHVAADPYLALISAARLPLAVGSPCAGGLDGRKGGPESLVGPSGYLFIKQCST
jgi:hypothetical protein